jgi:hypothetical protein
VGADLLVGEGILMQFGGLKHQPGGHPHQARHHPWFDRPERLRETQMNVLTGIYQPTMARFALWTPWSAAPRLILRCPALPAPSERAAVR